jgi:hypothetical protein
VSRGDDAILPSCGPEEWGYVFGYNSAAMKKTTPKQVEQPSPFTPGVSKEEVRQHAYELFRDKLPAHPLTLDDWVQAERDLVNSMQSEESG